MAFFDITFKNMRHAHLSQKLYENGRVNYKLLYQRFFLGIMFATLINLGILFTSCFAYSTIANFSLIEKIIGIILSYFNCREYIMIILSKKRIIRV